jgi:hypothetical protein
MRGNKNVATLAALNAPTSLKPLAVGKQQAAAMLGISVRSVENYIALKKLQARKIGTRTVLPVSSLERFIRMDQPSGSHPRRNGDGDSKIPKQEGEAVPAQEVRHAHS